MISIDQLNYFTRALSLSFILVILILFLPDDFLVIKNLLKYAIIISIIISLMFYKQVIENRTSSKSLAKANTSKTFTIYNQYNNIKENASTKILFQKLKEMSVEMANSINSNGKSAIYTIEPKSNVYNLQYGSKTEFKDLISYKEGKILDYILGSKKINQRDNPKIWESLFFGNSWKGGECAIFSPIKIHDSDLGFLLTRLNHFKNLSDKQILALKNLGEFISYNIENLDILGYYISQESSKSLILDILSNLNYKSDEQNIFNQYKYLFRKTFQYDRLTISIRKETENRRKIDKAINSIIKLTDGLKDNFVEGVEYPTNGTLHGLPIISGESVISEDWQSSYPNIARFNSSEENIQNFKSIVGSPILVENESKGSIILEKNNGNPFKGEDLKNLDIIGKTLGSSLEWLNQYNKIYENATHDGLSGLLNHQTFKERFNDEIQRAERFQHKMSVMIFDLDKFKNINDTLGHQYGDYIIQTCSQIMKDNVRAVDVVARYGGEEFAIILINTDVIMSTIVAQRIVDTIANYPFKMDGVDANITISGGMSEYPSDSKDMKELIEFADKAMYSSKGVGGNKFSIHSKIVSKDE
ncbi:MAG: GGDEF domain-containing protein [Candidatus Neomarinimicrobiota bacterium]